MKVFWSWQSDTHGKTGRHFVKQTLEAAIAQLREATDVEEPERREKRESLHVDHDRKGVRGSPRLADTILAKIDAARVFIADVTPVSIIPADTPNDPPKKRNMNPNVAIELGYALKVLGDDILMVLNEHYGGRETLPFDLTHLSGPIMYRLAPDADHTTIAKETKKLQAQLVEALKPYLDLAIPQQTCIHTPIKSRISRAAYWKNREAIAELVEHEKHRGLSYQDGTGLYLRVLPTSAQKEVPRATLLSQARKENLNPLGEETGVYMVNGYGVIAFNYTPMTYNLLGSTQVFDNKEIWGFTPSVVRNPCSDGVVLAGSFERYLRSALPSYVSFLSKRLGVSLPLTVEAGLVGIADRQLISDDTLNAVGTIYENEFYKTLTLTDITKTAVDTALLAIFEALFAQADATRPQGLFGFPTIS